MKRLDRRQCKREAPFGVWMLVILWVLCGGWVENLSADPPDRSGIDVHFYQLDIKVDPEAKYISGEVLWGARRTGEETRLIVELDAPLEILSMEYLHDRDGEVRAEPARFTREGESGQYRVRIPNDVGVGELFQLNIGYAGHPRVARNPPWDGGFVWSKSKGGAPWVGVTSQMSGASVWWPSKNIPSDRPDSVAMRWTVPDSLEVASNGVLVGVEAAGSGWKRWHWRVGHPISPYQLTLNAGPFRILESFFDGRDGASVPLTIWTLPEQTDRAEWLMEELKRQLDFFERWLGPYPFSDEKLGVVQTPYLGMEHQTILSYGSTFQFDGLFRARLQFDDLLHHELAHEWFGNLIVNRDWRHFWMHEGFATYMQALFAEELSGREGYMRMMRRIRPLIRSRVSLVPSTSATAADMDKDGRSADVYYKGAWILHTLREWIGPERFDPILKSFLWDGPGSQEAGRPPSRTVDSEMWISWLDRHLEEPIRPVLEHYLYEARLPRLEISTCRNGLFLRWSEEALSGVPVEVATQDGRIVLHIPSEGICVEGLEREGLILDPDHSILMGDPVWNPPR